MVDCFLIEDLFKQPDVFYVSMCSRFLRVEFRFRDRRHGSGMVVTTKLWWGTPWVRFMRELRQQLPLRHSSGVRLEVQYSRFWTCASAFTTKS